MRFGRLVEGDFGLLAGLNDKGAGRIGKNAITVARTLAMVSNRAAQWSTHWPAAVFLNSTSCDFRKDFCAMVWIRVVWRDYDLLHVDLRASIGGIMRASSCASFACEASEAATLSRVGV